MGKQGTLLLLGALLSVPSAAQPPDRSDQLLLATAAPNRETGLDERPNVLFIVADDLNVALGSYLASAPSPQYAGAKTPNLDRLAAEGIRFDRAYVQNPLCNPSRTSFLSGLRPPTVDVYNGSTPPRHKIGDGLRMLPEHFHDHGYFTARVGKIAHNTFEHVVTWDVSAFALSREPDFRFHLPGYLPGVDLSAQRDNTWTDGSEDGMSRADVLRPIGRRAGLPLSWRATQESPRMTPDGTTATRIVQLMARNRDKPFFIAAYHAMVTMTDSYVGQLLEALELLGLADSTIVVFTSDHGFQLNEHGGLWRKTYQFEESTRVPLIVRLPGGRQAGEVAGGLVELIDLYPTLIELCNLPKPAHELEGTSFQPLLDDLEQDPFEYENLALDPGRRAVVEELSRQLRAGWRAALPESI